MQAFVGLSPTQAKLKIQGFGPTDRWRAVHLSFLRGENMKKTICTLLTVFVCLGSCCLATAQAPVAQSDLITGDGQQIIQDDSSSTGTFAAVTVDPSASSDVALQFPVSMASKSVAVQPLDGGTVTSGSATIGADGSLSFSFQVTDQPGVHRVVVIDPNADDESPHIVAVVQFEVPSPAN
jgi:hypothetical protein